MKQCFFTADSDSTSVLSEMPLCVESRDNIDAVDNIVRAMQMMRMMRACAIALCIFGLSICLSVSVVAQVQPTSQAVLEELSLEELLNVEIVTASKTSEKLQDAPAVVSVITERDIANYGALSLYELLDRVASVYAMGSPLMPQNMMSVRGDNSIHFNNRVLVLIDGRPYRESQQGGNLKALYSHFPLYRIARIEVIRGPGSVLYGTGAYTAVFNIITKKASTQGVEARVLYGSFERLQADVAAGGNIGELEVSAGLNFINDAGWTFTSADERARIPAGQQERNDNRQPLLTNSRRMNLSGFGGNLSAKIGGFKLNAFVGQNQQGTIYSPPFWEQPLVIRAAGDTLRGQFRDAQIRDLRIFADAEYKHEFSRSWQASLNVTYNGFRNREFDNLPSNDFIADGLSDDILVELTNYITLNDNINIVVGGLLNNLRGEQVIPTQQNVPLSPEFGFGARPWNIYNLTLGKNPDPYFVIPRYNLTQQALYLQTDYSPASWIKIVAGAQANKIPNVDWDIVPRLGVIAKFTPELGIKLLGGQAFRSPTKNETSVRLPGVVIGDPSVRPEKITTLEAQMYWNTNDNRLQAALTYFNSQQRDILVRSFPAERLATDFLGRPQTMAKIVNRGERRSQGLELEGSAVVSREFSLQGSLTWQTNEDEGPLTIRNSANTADTISVVRRSNVTGMPQVMVKVGASYTSQVGLNAGFFYTFFGGAELPTRPIPGNASGATFPRPFNPAMQPVHLLTANITANIGKLVAMPALEGVRLHFYGTNLLDVQVMMPEVSRQNINTLPARAGRALYGMLSFGL
jgi:outer membrane receptor protein involved in Fe transport